MTTPSTLKLAISGTYSTGKSTTTEALSIATGIPRTHALTSREILIDLVPGKQVIDLTAAEQIKLGLRRFEERVHNEAGLGSFVSDGSVIHEWVYGEARMRVGINPGAAWWVQTIKRFSGLGMKRFYQQYMNAFGDIAKARAGRAYDAYVHLPVEFDMVQDGHRPVSERFRRLSDEILLSTLDELGLPYHVVGGTVPERLTKILDIFGLPLVVPLPDAIEEAQRRVRAALKVIEEDDRFHEARRKKSVRERLTYAMRY